MRVGLLGVGRIGAIHAETLLGLPVTTSLVIADADATRARTVADKLGAECADDPAALFASGVDCVVIAATSAAHADLIHRGLDARLPVFCEKPLAPDVERTRRVIAHVDECGGVLQVGFQRRFDAGYRAVREAVRSGRLGPLHTLRAVTADPAPPHRSYIPASGGIHRDCAVHDFDAIRWVSDREIAEVYATGRNKGEDFFTEYGDVDTAAAVLTLDDGTLATVSCTRYNGAGYDVRLEACGFDGTLVAGLDEQAPLPSAEPGVPPAARPSYRDFVERFRSAYAAELSAFTELAAGRVDNPCTARDSLAALLAAEAAELSRATGRPVPLEEVR